MDPPTEAPTASWRSKALHVTLLVLGASLFAWSLRGASLHRTAGIITGVGPLALILLVPQGLWTAWHAWAWLRLLALLDRPAPTWPLIRTFFTMEAARLTLPGGPAVSESLGLYYLRRRFDVPIADAVASQATKKFLVVATNGLYVAMGTLLAWSVLPTPSEVVFGHPEAMRALLLATAGCMLLLAGIIRWGMRRGTMAMALLSLLRRMLPGRRMGEWLDVHRRAWAQTDVQMTRPVMRSQLPRLLPPATILLAQWWLEGIESWLILSILGADVTFTQAIALEVAGSSLRSLVFAIPAGLGVQDAGYVAVIEAFAIHDATNIGAAFVLLKRGKELFWIGGGWVLLLVSRSAARADRGESSTEHRSCKDGETHR